MRLRVAPVARNEEAMINARRLRVVCFVIIPLSLDMAAYAPRGKDGLFHGLEQATEEHERSP